MQQTITELPETEIKFELKAGFPFAEVGKLYSASIEEANMFRFLKENRETDDLHVKKLNNSFDKDSYLYTPLIVNKDLFIIDGQNRFKAWRDYCTENPEKKFNILFIVVPHFGGAEAKKLNCVPSKKWTINNHIDSHIKLDKPDYIKLNEFSKTYGFDMVTSYFLLSGKTSRTNGKGFASLKEGSFEITDENLNRANEIANIITTQFNCYNKNTLLAFVVSFVKLRSQNKYDEERFLRNFPEHFAELQGRTGEKWIYDGLVRIHNHGSKGGRIELPRM